MVATAQRWRLEAGYPMRRAPSSTPTTPFRSVVAFAADQVSSFGLSMLSGIFCDWSHLGLPSFRFVVCAEGRGALRTDLGLLMDVKRGPEAMRDADLIILLPSADSSLTLREPVIEAIRSAHRRGAIIAAYCTGTFLLAETGLLDGHRATTNWSYASRLAARHTAITVDPEALYVDAGSLVTGAGTAAGIDMSLHLLRREHGTAVSNAIARETMVTPRRETGQVHYVPTPSEERATRPDEAGDTRLAELLHWTRTRLQENLSVDDLARHALMSPRTFARRFREVTGTTAQAWLRGQRLDRAEELLETSDLSIKKIAELVGFGSDASLREHFTRRHGIAPRAYRHLRQASDEHGSWRAS